MIQALVRPSTDGAMAKKKASKTVGFNPRAAGLQILTAASVRQLIAECRYELADMDSHLSSLEQNKITEVEVEGATKLSRALELVVTFSENLGRAVKKEVRKLRTM